MNSSHEAKPLDETLDGQPAIRSDGKARMAIVEGSTPQLASETNDLLRRRLRSAALLLSCGFLAFFVKSLFYIHRLESTADWLLFADHALTTLLTGMVALRLCTNCAFILRHLRVAESLVFGGSSLFFLLLGYVMLTKSASNGYLLPITPAWMILIFTYALFIPNTLRRASIIIGLMAVAPIALMIGTYIASEAYANVLTTNPDFSGFILQAAMLMTLTAVTAIWGAYTIGSLRRVAFEAKQLGQYRLKEQLGSGGMGEVYLAEHLLLKRPCAIKLIRPDKAGDAQSLARFEREVRSTAKLTHWNTVEIFDYGRSDDGTFYYVMEYLPGLNLGQLVEMFGPLPPERVIHLLAATCEALSEAHDQGLVHRDIKPANIFAAHRGGIFDVAKLLDFGLAKPLTNISDVGITQEGSITGSPLFMSPEQATGDSEPDERSDIYSIGVVAYYLLAGVPPFEGEHPLKVMLAHASKSPEPLTNHTDGIPADLEQVVFRCLEKDPDHRFQTAASLREAFLECDAAGLWTRDMAAGWWRDFGCPKKKALDAAVLEAAVA